ncbi:MAG: hypothetical protein ACYC0V_18305 [Armatimonadota bacterium]
MKGICVVFGLIIFVSAAYAANEPAHPGMTSEWWSSVWAARWVGIIGGSFGALGGILGALTGVYANRGKAKTLIIGMWIVFLGISTVSLLAGFVALAGRQSFWVYYPLLLMGFIGTIVGGSLMRVVHAAYAQAELRQMHARDVIDSNGR